MQARAEFVPALALRRQLEALGALGMDVAQVRAVVGDLPAEADGMVPVSQYNRMWETAQALCGLPGMPSAMALAIPFGAFGALDYLAGSACTVGALCESVLLHLSMVAVDVRIQHERLDDGSHVIEARGVHPMPAAALEFTLATIFGRLRYVTQEAFVPVAVALPAEAPSDDPVRRRLWHAPLSYGYPCASFRMTHAMWERVIPAADPYLHAVLQRMAPQLHLARHPAGGLEQALRVRLRDALADGAADPARLAVLLGISVRTLQRRLRDAGRSFSAVVEDFRKEEALRLLQDPRVHLVRVAARLGYAEQTSFTRAFRRWTGDTPGAWRVQRSYPGPRAVSAPPDSKP